MIAKHRENLIRRAKEGVFYMITSLHAFDYEEALQGLGYFLPDLDELRLEDQDELEHEVMIDALDDAIRFYADEAGDNLLKNRLKTSYYRKKARKINTNYSGDLSPVLSYLALNNKGVRK